MPPRNFRVSDLERLSERFRGMVRQTTSWADPLPDIRRVKATSVELSKHVRPGARKDVLTDARGLLFPSAHARHALARELDADSAPRDKRHLMRSLFCFGVPLNDGYLHDVQYPGRGPSLRTQLSASCRTSVLAGRLHAQKSKATTTIRAFAGIEGPHQPSDLRAIDPGAFPENPRGCH